MSSDAEPRGGEDAAEGNAGEGGGEDEEDEDADEDDEDTEETSEGDHAPGYYILYGLKIAGLKETPIRNVLKRWASNFLKGFGLKLRYMNGGSGEEKIGVKDIIQGARSLFGAIDDPKGLADEV